MNDSELLQRYAQSRCEAAFTEVVQRHVDFVYSSALRQVGGDGHLAQDVTQNVFLSVAQKAETLAGHSFLRGWLYTAARFAAAKAVRADQRRHARHQEAHLMQEQLRDADSGAEWERVHPVLDEVMHELSEPDRHAILARYFESRPLAEIGAEQGLSADGARMRISRALDKLRDLLARRGVTSSTAALALLLTQHAVTAAPAGLSLQIAGAAIAGATAGTTLSILNLMATTKLKLGILGAIVAAGLATPLVMQHQAQRHLRDEIVDLRRQNDALTFAAADARAPRPLPPAAPNLDRLNTELLRLRGEVTRLQMDSAELARLRQLAGEIPGGSTNTFQTLAARVALLAQKIDEQPGLKIPELKFLTYQDWVNTVWGLTGLETQDALREAACSLRSRAKSRFGMLLMSGVGRYATAHDDLLPAAMADLDPYLDLAEASDLLSRYQFIRQGRLHQMDASPLITEIAAPVDDEYDTQFQLTRDGSYTRSFSQVEDRIENALQAYASTHDGQLPASAAELEAHAPSALEPARIERFLRRIPPGVKTLAQYQLVMKK